MSILLQELAKPEILLPFGSDQEVILKLLSLGGGQVARNVLVDQLLFNYQELFVNARLGQDSFFKLRRQILI